MSKVTKYFRGKVRSIDSESFTADVVISDETKDRYDERVLVTAFKKTKSEFMKHPVLLSSHAYRGLMNQIGMFEDIKIDSKNKEVVGKVKWFVGEGNPEADWGFKLAEHGIAAFSIGFIAKKTIEYDDEAQKKNGGIWRDFEEIELLETSQVLIPANPSALMKSFGDNKDDLFLKELSDQIVSVFKEGEATEDIKWDEAAPETKTLNEETPEEVVERQEAREVKPETGKEEVKGPTEVGIDELKEAFASFLIAFNKSVDDAVEKFSKAFPAAAELTVAVDPESKSVADPVIVSDEETVDDSISSVLGEEKLAELKEIMLGNHAKVPKDAEVLKAMFDNMTKELTGIFTAQQ